MRLAWFSPLPPARTGIAGYSADILPRLDAAGHEIDRFPEARALEFAWRHRRNPYDLIVYQLGNAPWHDYMWAYLVRYPGLVVLHDARLHHARAAQLLRERRVDDYRREFAYDHPDAAPAAADFVAEGLGGAALYFWPMTRVAIESARLVAVHNSYVAAELRERHPSARVERIHLGTPVRAASPAARAGVRQAHHIPADSIVFVTFGLATAEKRIEPILRALAALGERGVQAHLLIVGDVGFPQLDALIAGLGLGNRVHTTGYIDDDRIADYLSAGDVSLSLRWPSALETSGAWCESLAASKPTVISLLPHTADVPSIDARSWQRTRSSQAPVAVSIDLLDEDAALLAAMSRLAEDRALREELGRAGHEYWKAEHHLDVMAADYARVLAQAAAAPMPAPRDLPAHLTRDYSALTASIAREIGVDLPL